MSVMTQNRVTLVGFVGIDPELRRVGQQKTPMTVLKVGTIERWKNRAGERQERTDWHRVIAWRRHAELIAEHFRRGDRIWVDGRLRCRPAPEAGFPYRFVEVVDWSFVDRRPSGQPDAIVIEPDDDDDLGYGFEDDLPYGLEGGL